MKCTVLFAGLAAVAAAAPSVVVRQTLSGPEIPEERSCTPSGTKCAGDEGFPSVPFAPCCDGEMSCGYPLISAGTWGQYCLPAAAVTKDKTQVVSGPPTTTVAADIIQTSAVATTVTDADGNGVTTTTVATTTVAVTTDKDGSTVTSVTSKDDDDSACFPSDATVELENGAVVRMDSISIGDMVKVGVNEYSRVFMFTHKMAGSLNKFVILKTATGASLSLTKGHYLYVNNVLAAASTVSVGDSLILGSGDVATVVSVEESTGTGLFNPQTVNGNIVVDGVISSTYTTAVEPAFAHALLAPLRMISSMFGVSVTALESGSNVLARAVPQGMATL